MSRRPAVALLIETSNAYARGLLRGIIEFQRERDAWSVYLPEQERGALPPQWLRRWRGDGLIARIENDAIARAVQGTGLPVVDVSAARKIAGIPWVETDDRKVAELAAQHLLDRGFTQLAYCGEPQFNWSRWRGEAFRQFVASKQAKFWAYPDPPSQKSRSWLQEKTRLATWLTKLPRPIGIMASYDIQARRILDLCRELQIAVPEEMAVVGVDNDSLVCNLSSPSLSSVIPDAVQAGYRAAQLLDDMLRGAAIPGQPLLLPPLGVATRQSTDVLAVDDPWIAQVAKWIREHACEGIQVEDVARHFSVSRRVLERRFKLATARTPHAAILSQKLERVASLLRDSSSSIEQIASRCGFEHPEYLQVAFRKHFGTTPGLYRKTKGRSMSGRAGIDPP